MERDLALSYEKVGDARVTLATGSRSRVSLFARNFATTRRPRSSEPLLQVRLRARNKGLATYCWRGERPQALAAYDKCCHRRSTGGERSGYHQAARPSWLMRGSRSIAQQGMRGALAPIKSAHHCEALITRDPKIHWQITCRKSITLPAIYCWLRRIGQRSLTIAKGFHYGTLAAQDARNTVGR